MKQLVLIAEDEKSIADILALNLTMEGYEVLSVGDGESAVRLFRSKSKSISMVLLDVMMPGKDGFTVCTEIKSINPEVPVMILTAKGESEDRVKGLKMGADDYLVKPFDLEELILRVNNLLKRKYTPSQIGIYEFAGNRIDFDNWTFVGTNNLSGSLTKREIQLIRLLIQRKNAVVSRDEILENVWDKTENPSARTIDNMILLFRKYFEPNSRQPVFFHSVRGVGYRFTDQ